MSQSSAVIDLYRKLTTDDLMVRRIEKEAKELERIDSSGVRGPEWISRVTNIFTECGGNLGLLVPYFYPKFLTDENNEFVPLSLLNRPFLLPLLNVCPYSATTVSGSRQLGKSTGLVARKRILAEIISKYSGIYVAPHNEHVRTFANRFKEMEAGFRFPARGSGLRQNLRLKEYANGSKIELLRILLSAADSRGKTADDLSFDEFQDFDAALLGDVEQVLRASKRPTTIYTGTAKTIDTPLETAYQESSRGVWLVRSGDGRTYLNTADPKTALSIIREEGPTCPITSKPLNMLDGFFVHEDTRQLHLNNIGYRVPQLIVEDFVKDPLEWTKIWRFYKKFGDEKTLMEVLGIPIAEGTQELTRAHLEAICVTGPQSVALKRAKAGYYKLVVSGLDWGGSDENPATRTKTSYTAHAILGLAPDGRWHILHMKRYAGMKHEEIAHMIMQDHARFGGMALASDFGGGSLYRLLLLRGGALAPSRHLVFDYMGPDKPYLMPIQTAVENAYGLNRSESITRLYMALRDTPQNILCYSWADAQDELMDCLNLYRIPSEAVVGGRNFFRYRRHGSRPDDVLHALNFGFTVGRLLNGEKLFREPLVQRQVDTLLGRGRAIYTGSDFSLSGGSI